MNSINIKFTYSTLYIIYESWRFKFILKLNNIEFFKFTLKLNITEFSLQNITHFSTLVKPQFSSSLYQLIFVAQWLVCLTSSATGLGTKPRPGARGRRKFLFKTQSTVWANWATKIYNEIVI